MSLRWTRNRDWHIARFSDGNLEHCVPVGEAIKSYIGGLPLGCKVAISFRGIEWVSSQVIGMILAAKAATERRAGKFALTSPSGKVLEVLKITQLARSLTITESTNDLP